MARVPLKQPEDLPQKDREVIWRRGNLYKVFANSPEFAARFASYGFWINDASQIELRMQELIILRIAFLLGSEFEWSAHVRKSIEGNALSAAEVSALGNPMIPPQSTFTAVEAATLRLTEDIVLQRSAADADFTFVRNAYSDSYMVELAGLIGMYVGLAHTIALLKIDLGPEQAHWIALHPLKPRGADDALVGTR